MKFSCTSILMQEMFCTSTHVRNEMFLENFLLISGGRTWLGLEELRQCSYLVTAAQQPWVVGAGGVGSG